MAIKARKLPFPLGITLLILVLVIVLWYWDRLDPAEYFRELFGFTFGIIIYWMLYSLVIYLNKKHFIKSSQLTRVFLPKYSGLVGVAIILLIYLFLFPLLINLLIANYGVTKPAHVTDHYFTYSVFPIGSFQSLLAGTKKTDEFDATDEVIKYRIVNSSVKGTVDFPFNAYSETRKSQRIDTEIIENQPVTITYLPVLPFIAQINR